MVAGLPVRVAFAGVGGSSGGDPLEFGGDRGQLFLTAGGVAFGFDGVVADDPEVSGGLCKHFAGSEH